MPHTHTTKESNAQRATPPRSTTPPPAIVTEKRKSERKSNEENVVRIERATHAESIDPNALSKALMGFEDVGSQSPSRKKRRVYGDR
jgi:hypothetical protein